MQETRVSLAKLITPQSFSNPLYLWIASLIYNGTGMRFYF